MPIPAQSSEDNREHSAVVVMARHAKPGAAKTRLIGPLSADEACRIYEACLDDFTEKVREWNQYAVCHIAVAPDTKVARNALGERFPGARLIGQPKGDLSAKLGGLLTQLRGEGFRRVIFVGSDSPALPPDLVRDAVEWLWETDVVVGPALDGGYWGIGLRDDVAGLFDEIPWSTDRVFAATVERATARGLTVQALPFIGDIDTPDDLVQFFAYALAQSSVHDAPRGFPGWHTWRLLNEMAAGQPFDAFLAQRAAEDDDDAPESPSP